MSPRLLVLLAALCFGTTGTAAALGPDGMQPVVVGTMRIVIGGGLLAALAWRRDGHGRRSRSSSVPAASPAFS